jgi:uncharacterized protein YbjT (DUF2867 family)
MKILVYGGTGSQGGAVVAALLERGHTPLIATRAPEKAARWVAMGAQTVHADLGDPASIAQATAQADAVSLMIPAFLPDPRLAPQYAHTAIDAAAQAGKFVVYNTSGTVINQQTGNPMYDMRLHLIDHLQASGARFVTIEPTAYMENLLGPWTRPGIIAKDELAYPVEEDTPIGWVATRDVGALIAAALERPDLHGRRFGVSGPDNLTGPALAEQFSEGLGRRITYRAMPLEEFGAALDSMFGPGAGEGGVAGYRFQRENKDLLQMYWDMREVTSLLPVSLTRAADFARDHAPAFAPGTNAFAMPNL